MALSSQSVDAIFAKLALAYGHRFLSIWDGLPIEQVKADWAHELDGMSDAAILYGLTNLPAGRPPDVFAFREVCRRMPAPARQASLPDMRAKPKPKEIVQRITEILKPRAHAEPERVRWARRYIERFGGDGQRLSFNQRETMAHARRVLERHERGNAEALEQAKREAQAKVDARMEQQHAPQ